MKFRFYDKTLKKMVYLSDIWNMPDPDYDFDSIQQSTGLLDKQGKEIYEGDLLKTSSYPTEVRWNTENGRWDQWWHYPKEEDWHDNRIGLSRWEKVEVIGNIYENKDLI